MWDAQFHALIKREHYHDQLARAEHARLIAALPARRRPFARAAARLLGSALLHLGVALLRYGRIDSVRPIQATSPRINSIKLN